MVVIVSNLKTPLNVFKVTGKPAVLPQPCVVIPLSCPLALQMILSTIETKLIPIIPETMHMKPCTYCKQYIIFWSKQRTLWSLLTQRCWHHQLSPCHPVRLGPWDRYTWLEYIHSSIWHVSQPIDYPENQAHLPATLSVKRKSFID